MNNTSNAKSRVAVVACGVLAADFRYLERDLHIGLDLHFLPGGLHRSPSKLRDELQKKVNEISNDESIARIVIGYGLCGRGTVGIKADRVPLVIPRVHDCIALFLGSDKAYREQFARHPGTYYLSAGWVEENNNEQTNANMGAASPATKPNADTKQMLETQYGQENAEFVDQFMHSWTRNYTRAAFIDTGVGDSKEHYATKARNLAQQHGWEYERLEGTHSLLLEAIRAEQSSATMLLVPPFATTVYDALRSRLAVAGDPSVAAPETEKPDIPIQTSSPDAAPSGIGLGIDAGGTYTDAVLYDFAIQKVISKAKAPTTHWDYSVGIQQALSKLDNTKMEAVSLVAVSTTIATNAIVEHHGQSVGLLIMPPCGWTKVEGFQHAPIAIIRGKLGIDGTEQEPVDEQQVENVAKHLIKTQDISAFAVGGYAASNNPAHELQVKKCIEQKTGLTCTCSHEMSDSLHYRVRAETAALNARIIPCLEELLTRIQNALQHASIKAPIMVVRSDGSFMNIDAAKVRPLETMLSGPAASAAGAAWLARSSNALILDIGGTTTDTAIILDNQVRMNAEGASIGGWQTHIKALDLQTTGLGGDSCIQISKGQMIIGPERIVPVCMAANYAPHFAETLKEIEATEYEHPPLPQELILLMRSGRSIDFELSADEQNLVTLLESRPYTLQALAAALGKVHPSMLPLKKLKHHRVIQTAGYTPTDALHALGKLDFGNTDTAIRFSTLLAGSRQNAINNWCPRVIDEFEFALAAEIIKKELIEVNPGWDGTMLDQFRPLVQHMIGTRPNQAGSRFKLETPYPIIGIGAPAACFVEGACRRLGLQAIIPENAEVANAVGAITGSVSIRHNLSLTVTDEGLVRITGAPGAPVFKNIEAATAYATRFLKQYLTEKAVNAGCANPAIEIKLDDRQSVTKDGTSLFIERVFKGRASGAPTV